MKPAANSKDVRDLYASFSTTPCKLRSLVGLVVKRITSNDKITGSIPVRGMIANFSFCHYRIYDAGVFTLLKLVRCFGKWLASADWLMIKVGFRVRSRVSAFLRLHDGRRRRSCQRTCRRRGRRSGLNCRRLIFKHIYVSYIEGPYPGHTCLKFRVSIA